MKALHLQNYRGRWPTPYRVHLDFIHLNSL
jgi:hypothetical protein